MVMRNSVHIDNYIRSRLIFCRKERSDEGFTLLELLISITLLALVVTIAMAALRLASRSLSAGERVTEKQERIRMATTIMDSQIQSQLPLTTGKEGEDIYYFQGDDKNVQMATTYSLWEGRQGIVIVTYQVVTAGDERETLYATERTPGKEGERKTPLFTSATDISFQYYLQERDEETGTWSDQWDGETSALLPADIRLNVAYGPKKYSLLFPVRARGDKKLLQLKAFAPGKTAP